MEILGFVADHATPKGSLEGVAYTLNAKEYRGPMIVFLRSLRNKLIVDWNKKMRAICAGNGQSNQAYGEQTGALNCMHDQQAVLTIRGGVRRVA